jgi:hypothetical protein
MNFDQARKWVMPGGKYAGQALDRIAGTDQGLLYLDWMRGQTWCRGDRKEALDTYLGEPAIARELEQLIEDRGD